MCVECVLCVLSVCVVCVVCVVCGVCRTNDSRHGESLLARAYYAPNWVAEYLGASSRRPRHPFPALMAGEPLAVYLCTRPKKTSQTETAEPPQYTA